MNATAIHNGCYALWKVDCDGQVDESADESTAESTARHDVAGYDKATVARERAARWPEQNSTAYFEPLSVR